jgi:hypothetical protein
MTTIPALIRNPKDGQGRIADAQQKARALQDALLARRLGEIVCGLGTEITALETQRDSQEGN